VSLGTGSSGAWELSPDEERDLVLATEAGDKSACRQLVRAFLPAITAVARRYASTGIERTELIDEGVVGLLRAAGRYEPCFDTPFWAYASWWVRQAMQKLVADVTGPAVLSDRAMRSLAAVKAARRDYLRDHGHEPSRSELAAATGFTAPQLDSLLAVERTPRALEDSLTMDDGTTVTLGQTIGDPWAEEEYERVLDRVQVQEVRDLTAVLDQRERAVLFSHFGLGERSQTLTEIGARLGVTPERVRQIEGAALQKLRHAAAHPPLPGPEAT
jgi:RNA polymerase sigma factor (sigma-70 family)